MSISSDELERFARDAHKKRRIKKPTYCARCGYDLRSLPCVHKCPECGSKYDARHSHFRGIFLPQSITFPWIDLGITLVCGVMATLQLVSGVPSGSVRSIGVGCMFALLALVLGYRAVGLIVEYARLRSILKRIQREEDG